jgi:TolA-binding protein
MNFARCAIGFWFLALFSSGPIGLAQYQPEIRRAQPVQEPPISRALPLDTPSALPEKPAETTPRDSERADRRQIDYANGLFTRKLYDLAIPEYQKYLDDFRGGPGSANAYFSLGECYRNLHRPANARTSFQKVLSDYSESEFAGPAAYALGEMAFTDKDYA